MEVRRPGDRGARQVRVGSAAPETGRAPNPLTGFLTGIDSHRERTVNEDYRAVIDGRPFDFGVHEGYLCAARQAPVVQLRVSATGPGRAPAPPRPGARCAATELHGQAAATTGSWPSSASASPIISRPARKRADASRSWAGCPGGADPALPDADQPGRALGNGQHGRVRMGHW